MRSARESESAAARKTARGAKLLSVLVAATLGCSALVNTQPASAQQSTRISARYSSVSAGRSLPFTWSGNPGPDAYVLLVPVGKPYQYNVSYSFIDRRASGRSWMGISRDVPDDWYDLRLITLNRDKQSYTQRAKSSPVRVTQLMGAFGVSPAPASRGGLVTLTWRGLRSPTSTDWVGLYNSIHSEDDQMVDWAYTNGKASGKLTFRIPANVSGDTWELRVFAWDGWGRIGDDIGFAVR